MITKEIVVNNASGLHMRPASIFVKTIQPFQSSVFIAKEGSEFNAKSMLNLLGAGVKCGDRITLRVDGADEQECMDTAVAAIESGLGE